MSEIEVKIRDDKAMLYTPYNPEFVKRIKKFSDARWIWMGLVRFLILLKGEANHEY